METIITCIVLFIIAGLILRLTFGFFGFFIKLATRIALLPFSVVNALVGKSSTKKATPEPQPEIQKTDK